MAYLGVTWTQERNDLDQTIAGLELERGTVEEQLTGVHVAIAGLEQELQQLEEQRSAAEAAFGEITSGRVKWSSNLTALFASERGGVRFTRISTAPDGTIELSGAAESPRAVAGFPSQLAVAAPSLDLQNLQSQTDEDGVVTFTGLLRVSE